MLNIKIIVKDKKEYKQKYINHIFSFTSMAAINHPKWLIEEKAIIFRKEVWFNPLKDPIITDKIMMALIKLILKQ